MRTQMGRAHDEIVDFFDATLDLLKQAQRPPCPVLGRVLAAAWRAALVAVAEGSDPQQARAALLALEFRLSS
jgi:hypothetical protein